jgi:hypothetical protein
MVSRVDLQQANNGAKFSSPKINYQKYQFF